MPRERASVALKTGDLELFAGRMAEAEQGFREAHALYAGAQDELGRAYALARLGDLDLRRGRSEVARQSLREALALFQAFPAIPGLARCCRAWATQSAWTRICPRRAPATRKRWRPSSARATSAAAPMCW